MQVQSFQGINDKFGVIVEIAVDLAQRSPLLKDTPQRPPFAPNKKSFHHHSVFKSSL
ncbi:hypothetical protein [Ursidibacter arcticus]